MRKLIILSLIGFVAQLVDGSLGMGYGVTSSSLLLLYGITPALASASVHFAEVVTTAASGISHLRFGNVDKETVWRLIIPGSIGAFIGACFLSHLPGNEVKPFVSMILFCLGVYVLWRFLFNKNYYKSDNTKKKGRFLVPLGLVAGFLDATGGGGWGPISTPVLLSQNRLEPRKVIGSVDTSEFAISLSASVGFFISLDWTQIDWLWVFTLMLGGLFAAPLAAWIVKVFPTSLLGVAVGGVILLTNANVLQKTWGLNMTMSTIFYGAIVLVWTISFVYAFWKMKGTKLMKKEKQSDGI
ncbi:sulfite exporter TauE/SafE family protein [Thermoflavimicrobium dichotomicum]|uniref:sulfite exporter TauE/SafE family protein n=1 Tax=Thermoflavimicrobium dichotomicum TaxID=46223 RepID=UPI0011137AC3|nr:sulfite exporter TauE/SafE family protein [Thermoflavimicrobium dichotomicum]